MKREVTEHLSQCPLRLRGPLQVSWVPLSVSLRSSRVTARQRCCFGNLYGLPEWWAGAGLHWVTSQRASPDFGEPSTFYFLFSLLFRSVISSQASKVGQAHPSKYVSLHICWLEHTKGLFQASPGLSSAAMISFHLACFHIFLL